MKRHLCQKIAGYVSATEERTFQATTTPKKRNTEGEVSAKHGSQYWAMLYNVSASSVQLYNNSFGAMLRSFDQERKTTAKM